MEFKALAKEDIWGGGWYQPIVFPDGSKTNSTKYNDFFERNDFGERKWDNYIKPYLQGKSFLEIGCNAGLFLVLAEKAGFDRVFGLEKTEYFYEQCLYVLKQFDSKAVIYNADALKFDYDKTGDIDTILLSNALYWIGFDDEGKYCANYEQKIDKFLRKLAFYGKRIIFIGENDLDRIGGNLDMTLPWLQRYFDIKRVEVLNTGHRILNLIVTDTKIERQEIDIDKLVKIIQNRGYYANDFVYTFCNFINGYIAYTEWLKQYRDSNELGKGNILLHSLAIRQLNLLKSIMDNGLQKDIEIFNDNGEIDIDGWHRLLIMQALGQKTIKCRKNKDVKLE